MSPASAMTSLDSPHRRETIRFRQLPLTACRVHEGGAQHAASLVSGTSHIRMRGATTCRVDIVNVNGEAEVNADVYGHGHADSNVMVTVADTATAFSSGPSSTLSWLSRRSKVRRGRQRWHPSSLSTAMVEAASRCYASIEPSNIENDEDSTIRSSSLMAAARKAIRAPAIFPQTFPSSWSSFGGKFYSGSAECRNAISQVVAGCNVDDGGKKEDGEGEREGKAGEKDQKKPGGREGGTAIAKWAGTPQQHGFWRDKQRGRWRRPVMSSWLLWRVTGKAIDQQRSDERQSDFRMICGASQGLAMETAAFASSSTAVFAQQAAAQCQQRKATEKSFAVQRRISKIDSPSFDQLLYHPIALLHYVPKNVALFISGAFAGAFAKTLTAPLDRVKLLLQVQSIPRGPGIAAGKNLGFLEAMTQIGQEGGVAGYWKGNVPQVIRVVPYSAVQLCAYETFKRIFKGRSKELCVPGRLVAGACAGMTSTLVTYPLDVLRLRMAVDPSVKGMGQTLELMLREEGIGAFYRGLGPSLLGIAPYIAMNFCVFDILKNSVPKELQKRPESSFVIALCSSSVATFACYPLDTVRRQMQMRGSPFKSVFEAIPGIIDRDGVKGLYRGFIANALKNLPNTSIRLATFDAAKCLIKRSHREFEELVALDQEQHVKQRAR